MPCRAKVKRRSFLLIEVLTSICIAGIVIAACITLLTLFVSSKGKQEHRLVVSQKRWQKANYLRWIFMNINGDGKSLFVVEDGPGASKRLIFHMNRGVDSSPNDASDVLAMLYLDEEKGLMLVHKPLKAKKEIGLEEEKGYAVWPHAKEIRWSFFCKNDLVQDGAERRFEWKETWPKEEKKPPLAIKAFIVEKDDSASHRETEVTGIVLSQMKNATVGGG